MSRGRECPQWGDLGSIPRLGRCSGDRHGNPLQYSCLKNPHGQRSLAGHSPWGLKESDMAERLTQHRGAKDPRTRLCVQRAPDQGRSHMRPARTLPPSMQRPRTLALAQPVVGWQQDASGTGPQWSLLWSTPQPGGASPGSPAQALVVSSAPS